MAAIGGCSRSKLNEEGPDSSDSDEEPEVDVRKLTKQAQLLYLTRLDAVHQSEIDYVRSTEKALLSQYGLGCQKLYSIAARSKQTGDIIHMKGDRCGKPRLDGKMFCKKHNATEMKPKTPKAPKSKTATRELSPPPRPPTLADFGIYSPAIPHKSAAAGTWNSDFLMDTNVLQQQPPSFAETQTPSFATYVHATSLPASVFVREFDDVTLFSNHMKLRTQIEEQFPRWFQEFFPSQSRAKRAEFELLSLSDRKDWADKKMTEQLDEKVFEMYQAMWPGGRYSIWHTWTDEQQAEYQKDKLRRHFVRLNVIHHKELLMRQAPDLSALLSNLTANIASPAGPWSVRS